MRKLGIYPLERLKIPLAEQIETIARCGFDYVCASTSEQLTEEGLGALAERYGLFIDNVHLNCSGMNGIWLETDEGDALIGRLKEEIVRSADCGVRRGIVHVTWGLEKPPLTEIGLERLWELTRFAERREFVVCFENSVSAAHLSCVLDNIRSDCAAFCFDTGHWNAFAPDSDVPFRYAGRLGATHIQDNDGAHDLHLLPFDGTVNYESIAPVLAGLDRLTLEPGGVARTNGGGLGAAACLSVGADRRLVDARGEGFAVYERMSYRAYAARAWAAAERLDSMLDAAAPLNELGR